MASGDGTWLGQSGQRWKLRASEGLLILGGLWLFLGTGRAIEEANLGLVLAPFAPGALGLLALSLAIRCRKCGTAVGWWVLSKEKAGAWLTKLETMPSCPMCGDDGQGAQH